MIRDEAELRALTDAVTRLVDDRLIPAEAEVDETDEIPAALIAEMKAMGLFGLSIPEAYGGLGLTCEEEAHVVMAVARAAPAFRSYFGTTIGIGSQGIVIDGTEAQKTGFLPRMASGELLASFCLTEPDTGSDASHLTTRAVPDGDGWRITGTKRYITNAPHAGIFTVMARSDPSEPGARGVSAFLVDADSPGITLAPRDRKMGQRGAHTCDVIFDDVPVPAGRIVGGRPGQGFGTAMKVLDKGRIHIGMVCVGAAERILEEALAYAVDRRQFDRPIAEFQLVQAMLADSRTEIYAARCMVLDAARRRDAGAPVTIEAAACKLFASEMCGRVADRAVQILGGAGYMRSSAVERFYRDVRLFRIYEGTSQIQQLVIARNMLKAMRD
ncbi:acyl-CoA dehydrogenase family protein [Salipiger sp.]|uniref:acyl-CoA dehydrogenase family protein n=1 Tax=Salipiger sp. TaxID=2078585 RepID=UPI003A971375